MAIRNVDGGRGSSTRAGSLLSIAVVLSARGTAALGGAGLSIVVGRILGAEGLGQFAFALSLVVFLAMLARGGLDIALLKFVAGARAHNRAVRRFPQVLDSILWTVPTAIVLSIICTLALQGRLLPAVEAGRVVTLAWAVLPLAVGMLVSGYLKGRGLAVWATLTEIGGVSFVAALFFLCALFGGWTFSAQELALVFIALAAAVSVLGFLWVARDSWQGSATPLFLARDERRRFRYGSNLFTVIAVAGFLIQAGSFVIAGPFLTDQELGLARAAERLALLVSFPVLAVNPYIASWIVRHSELRQGQSLKQLMRFAWILSVLLAMPIALMMLLFPTVALSLFGSGFEAATPLLRVLVLGQLMIAATGPYQLMLNLVGQERELSTVLLVSLLVSLILFPTAAHIAGALGFAAAYVLVNAGRGFAVLYLAAKVGDAKPAPRR